VKIDEMTREELIELVKKANLMVIDAFNYAANKARSPVIDNHAITEARKQGMAEQLESDTYVIKELRSKLQKMTLANELRVGELIGDCNELDLANIRLRRRIAKLAKSKAASSQRKAIESCSVYL
jgi:hypothetical protein